MRAPVLVALFVVACGSKGDPDAETSGSEGSTSAAGSTSTAASSSGPGSSSGVDATTTMSPTTGTPPGETGENSSSGPAGTSSGSSSSATTETTSGGSTTDATTGEVVECGAAPPADCDPNGVTRYCDSGPGCPLEQSTLYVCEGGAWTPAEMGGDLACEAEGFDFAFGCVADGGVAQVVCGDGPGTPCLPDEMGFCTDMTTLQACTYGKLADIDCVQACKDGVIDGMAHDSGYCMQSRIMPSCECCDGDMCP